MTLIAWGALTGAILLVGYAYFGYPAALWLLGRARPRDGVSRTDVDWPRISIIIPMFNEAAEARALLDSVLALDYPAHRRQILVISDASTDGTDEIVAGYGDRDIELVRLEERGGKTAAENEATRHVTGDIVVTTDASIRIRPDALKPLIAEFADPTVGVASGRDVSVSRIEDEGNVGESGYVGYEMWVRSLETRVAGIVGASGCFYAIRRELHRKPLPQGLSRDFASALIARENGFRAVSVDDAVCYVPRTSSLHREYRRKVRTVTRGMQTLWHKRHLMNPLRHGAFAWMLFSHKVCRWMIPWAAAVALLAVAALGATRPWLLLAPAAAGLVLIPAWLGWRWPESRPIPRLLSVPAFLVASNVALMAASLRAVRGVENSIWEPTRREGRSAGAAGAAGAAGSG